MMNRRTFLIGLCAPAVIRTPGILMPIRSIVPVDRYFGLATVKKEGDPIAWFLNENGLHQLDRVMLFGNNLRRYPPVAG